MGEGPGQSRTDRDTRSTEVAPGSVRPVGTPFEAEQRAQARAKYDAGELRAALHLWDSLEHPEQLDDDEVAMFETARAQVRGA